MNINDSKSSTSSPSSSSISSFGTVNTFKAVLPLTTTTTTTKAIATPLEKQQQCSNQNYKNETSSSSNIAGFNINHNNENNRTKVEKSLKTGSSALATTVISEGTNVVVGVGATEETLSISETTLTTAIDCNNISSINSSNKETESPTPKLGSICHRNSNKTRHCTSLPIFLYNVENTEICEIGSRPGMDCMPLRAPSGPYHHYHHVTDQTKSLQELQNEVGALLEFRDLVIETFPDLKHKMASMSATNTLTGMASSSSLASRREWEPGIRVKRKITPKENSADIVSSSLIRSRSNSHSGKKEPKSGEGNGSVVQDSGFSTETSSSKEAHSASSTTGAMQGTVASNRLSAEADDELLNLLDVIHRKSNRLRDEVEYLQNLEKDKFRKNHQNQNQNNASDSSSTANSSSCGSNSGFMHHHRTFQDHVEKLNREDLQILRKERDRLLDKLAEMEAETLAGRIKATKMQDQFEELCNIKKQLEEQLKLALSQKLELNSRLHELQRQYSSSSKSSSSQSESIGTNNSGHRNSSTTIIPGPTPVTSSSAIVTNLGTGTTQFQGASTSSASSSSNSVIINRGFAGTITTTASTTFQPVIVESSNSIDENNKAIKPFHSNNYNNTISDRDEILKTLGRLDGLISSPNRGTKVRVTDSRKIAAILLETNVIELQRHLLTLTVQNQVLTQRLEQATKSKIFLSKKLDRSKEEVDNIRFQLEEKDIELEGTKAQLRVLESKTPLKLDFNTENNLNNTIIIEQLNRSSLNLNRVDSPTTPTGLTQISTPSMRAMIPLQMDDIQHHSSSTESAQDQTERDSRLGYSTGSVSGSGCPETPKRRPSKIPLPGTKGYLAPKPPTGRNSISTSPSTLSSQQKISPSGPVSNKSLSRSTGSLSGKSGPSSVKRLDFQATSPGSTSSSLNRPESADSNTTTKDNSLGLNSSRSSSSSIPISSSTKSTPSPHKIICNSPLPKPKRDSLTSRVRHLDSLSRVHNFNNSSNSTPAAAIGTSSVVSSSSTPSSPSSPPNNNYLNNNLSSNNNKNNGSNQNLNSSTSNLLRFTSNASSNSTFSSSYNKKDLISSYTHHQQQQQQGHLRNDRSSNNTKLNSNLMSSSSSSTSSVSTATTSATTAAHSVRRNTLYGRSSNFDLHQHHHNNNQQQQQQNESESGKVRNLRSTLLSWLKI